MSDVLVKEDQGASMTLDVSTTQQVPFRRLVAVEARKMVDTRAGRWLLGITLGLLLLALGLALLVLGLNNDLSISASVFAEIMLIPVSLLVPVLAIVTVTSEWGQRTHLVTFTHEPHRLRVVAAKLVTVLLLALGTIAVAIVFGAVGNVLYGAMTGHDVVWDLEWSRLAWMTVAQLLYFAMAFGLAMVLLSTPAAVAVVYVVSLVLPLAVYSTLYFIFGWAQTLLPWIDMNYAMMPFLADEDPTGEPLVVDAMVWVRTGFTVLMWVVLPVVAGASRVVRSEVK